MTRHTRPQVERMEAVSLGVQRVFNAFNWTLLIFIGSMALAGGGIGYWIEGTERSTIGGAGWGAFVGAIFALAITWDLARRALAREGAHEPARAVDIGRPVQTGERQWRIPVAPPFDDARRLRICRQWLRDVHFGDATFSQDGTSTQRGGCSYGLTRQEVSRLKEWAIEVATWYYWINESNGSGGWTARGRAAIRELATVETGDVKEAWEAALIVREAPPPQNGDDASSHAFPLVTDDADGRN